MIAANTPRNLREWILAILDLAITDNHVPTIERICFAARWVVVVLSDGRAGRAFIFNGQHAVYGSLDFEHMQRMRTFLGCPVDAVLAKLLDESTIADAAQASLNRSVALALVNALSCHLNAPAALRERGFSITPPTDRSFLHPEDSVVLIGAGMLLHEAAQTCAQVDVVDMRPRAVLQSVLIEADGICMGPHNVFFHGVDETADLVKQADIIGITGCALENDTLFDIVRLPRHAREFVVFGPSAQAPMELFAALEITRVATNRIVDSKSLIEGMLASFNASEPRSATEGYVVTMPCKGAN